MTKENIELDTSRFPVIIVRPHGTVSDEEMRVFLGRFKELVRRDKVPFSLVLDLRFHKDMAPTQRRMIAAEIEDGEINALLKGQAFVFESDLMRMLLTAIFWLAKPKHEMKVFSDYAEALVWANMRAKLTADVSKAG